MIQGHGREAAEIIFVGDHASTDDLNTGLALSGYQESSLKSLLAPLSIQEVYRTLLIKDKLSYVGKSKRKFRAALDEATHKIAPLTYEKILEEEIVGLSREVLDEERSVRGFSRESG